MGHGQPTRPIQLDDDRDRKTYLAILGHPISLSVPLLDSLVEPVQGGRRRSWMMVLLVLRRLLARMTRLLRFSLGV